MKSKFCCLIIVLSFLSSFIFAQTNQLVGYWYNEEKTSKIEVYKGNDGQYYGKIIWLKEPLNANNQPKTDIKNPNAKNRSRALIGLNILKVKKTKEETFEGTIYDPKNGKEYSCTITFEDSNKLKLRGYIGFTMIGRTSYWFRTNN